MSFDTRACGACVNREALFNRGAPCQRHYERAKRAGMPIVAAFKDNEIGRGCPFTRPWAELYPIIGSGRAYHADEFTKSTIQNMTLRIKHKKQTIWNFPDMKADGVAKAVRYGLDNRTHRFGYTDSNQFFRPILTLDPRNGRTTELMRQFHKRIVPDPKTTWFGFAIRGGGGVGVGQHGGGGEGIEGVIYNAHKAANNGFEPKYFGAGLERTDQYGVDIGATLIFVYITGMDGIDDFVGTSFSGSDINVAFVVNLKAVANAGKVHKWKTIAEGLIKNKKAIEGWEKVELIGVANRWGSNAASGMSSGKTVNLIDIGAGAGIGLSYSKWKGTISSVSST